MPPARREDPTGHRASGTQFDAKGRGRIDRFVPFGINAVSRPAGARFHHMRRRGLGGQSTRENCGILVLNRDGRLQACNSVAQFLLGQPLAPGLLLDAEAPLCRSLARAGYSLEELFAGGKENHGFLKGGQTIESDLWFTSFPCYDEARQVSGAVITLVKRDEEESEHALKFLGLSHTELMDDMPEGIFMVNTRWQISYINETAQRITGFSRREALGRFCWEVFRGNLCHNGCPMRISMSASEVVLDREVEIVSRSGEKKLLLVNTSQVKKMNKVFGGIQTFHECGYVRMRVEKPAHEALVNIMGVSVQMQEVLRRLPAIGASGSNVLIQGESGTGKELVARAVHLCSRRSKGPFVAVNCSAIPESLIESELFGHERGAFTGAVASKPGRFELARGGTFFLDEIGDLKLHLQVKLLRVLEEKSFERVGGTRRIPLEARIVAATNVDLKEAMRQGRFREDFYFRLFTVPVHLPPLRERPDDIPILVKHFVESLNRKFGKQIKGVDPKVMKIFSRHAWHGNVRELKHVLEHCFVFAKGSIIAERHLPDMDGAWTDAEPEWDSEDGPLRALERKAIVTALGTAGGNKQDAARLLKISRTKLWRKMKLYGITEVEFKSGRSKGS